MWKGCFLKPAGGTFSIKMIALGTSLVVQWLKCCVPNAGGLHSGAWVRFLVGEVRSHMLQLK